MEGVSQYDKDQFWNDILEIILPIGRIGMQKILETRGRVMHDDHVNFVPYFYLEKIETLFKKLVEPIDYKYEVAENIFKEFSTRVKLNHQLLEEWGELYKEINLEFYKNLRCLERSLSKKKRKQLAPYFRQLR